MVVGIDPETGKLGPPTAEQRAELEQISASQNALLSHSSAGLVEEHRADGTVHVNLQGRFQEYATVRIGPDGKKTFDCVDDTTGVSKNASRSAPTGASAGATAAPATAAPALEER
ncbi:MAG: post-PEP-CTERM-1 domain-containing protein [Candidatus Eiseniibacteriota bacterium]